MKIISFIFLLLCFIEIYGQRSRATNDNQDVSTQEPRPVRGRGRSRFSAVEEPVTSERTTNRRASTRTRIHSNNPKAAANRRARPTEASVGYAVEEINNDSPIDSFRRQSKPRVLSESRFEIPTVNVNLPRRPVYRTSPLPPVSDTLPVEELGFGSTARAILQARGETLPPKTTTPVIDESYLLSNFGNTIRTIAAQRNEVPLQRATPLRSEVPILDKEDIPLRRSSLRGDPLPSLRNSEITLEHHVPTRGRKNGQARASTEQPRLSSRVENQRRTTETPLIEDIPRLEPESDPPESVEGINEQPEIITEAQPLEGPSESLVLEEEEIRKTTSSEVTTQKLYESPAPRRTINNNRARGRAETVEQYEYTASPRARASRTRVSQKSEGQVVASGRSRGSRRRYDDAAVAESRSRGPSVFTAEQNQDVTIRSRTGRRIDSRFERVPERITVDLAPSTTSRTRSPGRRATTTNPTPTEKLSSRDRNIHRGRSRSSSQETTSAPISKSTSNRRYTTAEDITLYGDKTRKGAEAVTREATSKPDGQVPRATLSRESKVDTSSDKRSSIIRSNGRSVKVNNKKERVFKVDPPEARKTAPSRSSEYSQSPTSDDLVPYGERSFRTRNKIQQTTTTEEPITIPNIHQKIKFPEVPPIVDESKLEVLPLFDRESRRVLSTRSRGHRSRSSVSERQNIQDPMHVSATENDVKFVEKPTTSAFTRVTVTRTESVEASTSRTRLSTKTASTTTYKTTTKPSTTPTTTTTKRPEPKKWVTRSPPVIRESVVAEVNEVTSKSTIMRRQKVSKAKAVEMMSRGAKKADIKLADVGKSKASSEEIDEEDNYPEAFKALIQAQKKQEVSRPSKSFAKSPSPSIARSTSTEKVIVTPAASPRGSSTARVVTTASAGSGRRSQLANEIINDSENELDPKLAITSTTPSTRTTRKRQLPKFSEKPKYSQKPYNKSASSKPKYEKSVKTTSTPRKTYSPKMLPPRGSGEQHFKRKALRSTASPPSTTPTSPISRENKFSAKFIRKEVKNVGSDNSDKADQLPKGLYSSKKDEKDGDEDVKKTAKKLESLVQAPKPSIPIKKFNSSRYSSRYRSDTSQRSTVLKSTTSAPFYTPTIPTPAYIPTVPTIAPSMTTDEGFVVEKDDELGLEVISFDDPVNTIPSADLVNGEYLATDKNFRLSAMVKDGTTEKPVSIIERIINSITSISTTAASNITSTDSPPTTGSDTSENSAILKLAPKKTTTKDKTLPDDGTDIIETITSEKPTTIIEKIRSSISAIQSNEVDSNRMGRLLETKPSIVSSSPVVTSTTTSTPSSTTVVSTMSTTAGEPKVISNTTSSPNMMSSDSMPSTTESSIPSTTSSSSTSTPTSSTSSPSMSTTTETNVVRIMAVPGEFRISKAQTTTTEPPSTVQSSTTKEPTSTVAQSTETIPPTLGEILNGKTFDALNNLLENVDKSSTKDPNFKTLEINQNSITSTTTAQSTTIAQSTTTAQSTTKELSTEGEAPFTSPTLESESTTQFLSSSDRLVSSTLISTLMPVSTTTQEPTTQRVTITSTTQPPTTTTTMPSTTVEMRTTTQRVETTTQKLTTTTAPQKKTTVAPRSATGFPVFSPPTLLPSLLTTLFPSLMRGAITTPRSPLSSTRKALNNADSYNSIGDKLEVLSVAGTTARPTTVLPQSSNSQRISTTTPPPTTTTQTTAQPPTSTTTAQPELTTEKAGTSSTLLPSTKTETDALFEQLKKSGKLKNLNEEQRRNLEEIERIEKEQAELLKQLTLLTTMFGGQAGKAPNLPPLASGNPFGGNSNNLANRIIAMAMERDKTRSTTTKSPPTTTKQPKTTTKRPNSIQDKLAVSPTEGVSQKTTPSLEDVLKQYNLSGLSTPVPLTSTYGKTDEALLAAILKEQGIGPTTPKVLADKVKEAGLFEVDTTTKAPKPKPKPRPTTTARPIGGRLMQGLNWLIDILDPPTTKRPAPRKPKAKPQPQPKKQSSGDEELLTNQPTRITPMVTAAPVTRPNLSQEELQSLIKQLEAVQENPNAADQLDFSKIKSLQNLLNVNEGVQVTSAGQHGATFRATSRPQKIKTTTEKDPLLAQINKKSRSSTISTLSVSNSIDDDVELISTTVRNRVLPPVSLNPIPGVDNQGDSLIRSNLLTAAVNVTRAISSFLGSALQDAANQVRTMIYSGTNALTNVSGGSTDPNIANISGDTKSTS